MTPPRHLSFITPEGKSQNTKASSSIADTSVFEAGHLFMMFFLAEGSLYTSGKEAACAFFTSKQRQCFLARELTSVMKVDVSQPNRQTRFTVELYSKWQIY